MTADAEQRRKNTQMSRDHSCVQDEFQHVTSLFRYLDFTLRSGSSPITQMYVVATFLKNVRICIHGHSETGDRFHVPPPSLDAYLNGFNPTQTSQS